MKNIKRVLIVLSFCMVLAFFMGVVSAASLNLTETELASEGVKNYTEAHGNIPGYVMVSDKNSSAASFLKTVTKTTVQLNSGSTAPVTISSVSSPTGPSGSATGNLYKSEYVTVANNVYNYIDSNGRAPNYASSSLGKIRYESLLYTYSKVVTFYQDNGYLPNYVSVVYCDGVDSTGVVIDNIPPSVNNSLAQGSYSTAQSVTLTATDSHDPNPKVYYSTNNGTTWNNQVKSVTLSLGQGVTTLKYYARDAAGNQGVTQTATYTVNVNPTAPTVTSSSPVNGETNVSPNKTITVTFNKPVQAGNMEIELENSSGTDIPITTSINNNILTVTHPDLLTADRYTLTLRAGSITDLAGNSLALWKINFSTGGIFSLKSVADAATSVKSYIESNHTLPDSINISGTQVTMPQFLELVAAAVININSNSNAPVPIGSYGAALYPSETITTRNITKSEYLDIANRVKLYMDTNGHAPNYATQTSTGSTIRYESLIYMYSQILNFYGANEVLPDKITVKPWASVSSSIIGNKSYGYVEKKYYGNQNSNQTIVLIIGVHPQENGIHTAIYNALTSKSADLSKRYVLYYVHVTQDTGDYSKGRMNGQLLAQEFIVPDVAHENPMLVMDNHENHGEDSGYTYYRFLYPISSSPVTENYTDEIISKMPFLVEYRPPNPTSPQYVTVPIANQGITTIIYETYMYDSDTKKASDANALINALDSLDKTSPTANLNVTANPAGGSFNTSKTVTLTLTDPNSSATIYYTTDGSDPQTSSTRVKYAGSISIKSTTTLKFAAVDSSGKWGSVGTETYILKDIVAPVVTNTDPVNRAVNVSVDKVVRVTFSEPVKLGSSALGVKDLSTGKYVPLTASVDGNVLTVTFSGNLVESTQYMLILGSNITDLSGNSLTACCTTFTTGGTAPTVVSVDPVNRAVNVSVDKVVRVTFSEPVKLGSSALGVKDLSTGKYVPLTASVDGNVLTVTFSGNLVESTQYMLILGSNITDLSGNSLTACCTTFTTGGTAPTVVSVDPVNNAVNVPTNKVVRVTFSEPVKLGSSALGVKDLSTGKYVPLTASVDGNVLTVTFSGNLVESTQYMLILGSNITDLSGNSLTACCTTFTTGGTVPATFSEPVKISE